MGFFAPLRMTNFLGWMERFKVGHGGGRSDERDFGGWGGCGFVPDSAFAGGGWIASVKLIGHAGFAYPKAVRAAVLGAMDAEAISVAEMSRLNWRLGGIYAEAVVAACNELGVETKAFALSRDAHLSRDKAAAKMGHPGSSGKLMLGLVGCHGQTVYHQGVAAKYFRHAGSVYVADGRGKRDCGAVAGAGGE